MARGVGGIGPANIMKHLKGIHFPIGKADIVELAKSKTGQPGFPDTSEAVGILEKIPDKEYGSVAEIMKAIGQVE